MPATFRLSAVGLLLTASFAVAQDAAKDQFGDPLPAGAVARLGTERLRNLSGLQQHPDGKHLFAVVNGTGSLIDPTTGLAVGKFGKGSRQYLTAISADGKRALGGGFNGYEVWEVESDKVVCSYKPEDRGGMSYDTPVLSADGKFLGFGGVVNDKAKDKGVSVTVWSVDENKLVNRLKVAQNQSATIRLSADGKRAVTWGYHQAERTKSGEPDPAKDEGNRIQFWDVTAGKELASGRLTRRSNVAATAISPAGDRAAASGGGGVVVVFDTATGKVVHELLGQTGVGAKLVFSPDGKTLAAAANEGVVQLFDVATGRSLGTAPPPVQGGYGFLTSIAFTAPDRAVALAGQSGAAVVWEVPSGKVLSPGGDRLDPPTGVTFAADGKQVTTVARGVLTQWDLSGKAVGGSKLTGPGVQQELGNRPTTFAAGGRFAVQKEFGLAVYDLPGGVQRFRVNDDLANAREVAFSADGAVMAALIPPGYTDKTQRSRLVVCETATPRKTAEYTLEPGDTSGLSVTPDGKRAAYYRVQRPDKGEAKTYFTAFDLTAGKVAGETEVKSGYVSPITAAAADNKSVLATTPGQPGLTLFDAATGKKGAEFGAVKLGVSTPPVFSADGKQVAIAFQNGYGSEAAAQIRVYDWEKAKTRTTYKGHLRQVRAMAFSPDGKLLATASEDTTVLLWDLTKELKD